MRMLNASCEASGRSVLIGWSSSEKHRCVRPWRNLSHITIVSGTTNRWRTESSTRTRWNSQPMGTSADEGGSVDCSTITTERLLDDPIRIFGYYGFQLFKAFVQASQELPLRETSVGGFEKQPKAGRGFLNRRCQRSGRKGVPESPV